MGRILGILVLCLSLGGLCQHSQSHCNSQGQESSKLWRLSRCPLGYQATITVCLGHDSRVSGGALVVSVVDGSLQSVCHSPSDLPAMTSSRQHTVGMLTTHSFKGVLGDVKRDSAKTIRKHSHCISGHPGQRSSCRRQSHGWHCRLWDRLCFLRHIGCHTLDRSWQRDSCLCISGSSSCIGLQICRSSASISRPVLSGLRPSASISSKDSIGGSSPNMAAKARATKLLSNPGPSASASSSEALSLSSPSHIFPKLARKQAGCVLRQLEWP